jgi:hypothetical protein
MGLTPSGISVVLTSLAHAAMRWTPALLHLEIFKCLLQRRDPALHEVSDHVHRRQVARCQALDPVQYELELRR